jgi:hypothetical protein
MRPIFAASYDAGDLSTAHPPAVYSGNKRRLLALAKAYAAAHPGYDAEIRAHPVIFTRWMEIRPTAPLGRAPAISVVRGPFAYAPDPDRTAWHVNFADRWLFVNYGTGLFAQDEHQVAEHPILASVREELSACDARRVPIPGPDDVITADMVTAATRTATEATPCLIENAARRLSIDTTRGLYGNAFNRAPANVVDDCTTVLDPPKLSNICAMAAPCGGSGAYDMETLQGILATAHTAFSAVVLQSKKNHGPKPTVVHTGAWGCGAYGGSVDVMSTLQFLAAWTSGIDEIVFHAFTEAQEIPATRARLFIEELASAKSTPVPSADGVVKMAFDSGHRWGTGDEH